VFPLPRVAGERRSSQFVSQRQPGVELGKPELLLSWNDLDFRHHPAVFVIKNVAVI
jgi:hypothetical protein